MNIERKYFPIFVLGIGSSIVFSSLYAQSFDPAVDGLIRNQQRQEELEKIIQPSRDVKLDAQQVTSDLNFKNIQEDPCFNIHQIKLIGEYAAYFENTLNESLKELSFKSGMCLGEKSINLLMVRMQNSIIDQGYTTTRIVASPQNLKSGVVELTVIPGLVNDIRIDLSNSHQTHADRIQYAGNIFPLKKGDLLNLHAIEQGLENFKRLPTVDADIQITPTAQANISDIQVKWKQRTIPVRLTLSVDDAGSEQTGKYQGSVTLSVDNPLFRSDLFYFTYGHDLADKTKITDRFGKTVDSGTDNYALHYSIPFKNWLVSFNASQYHYDQAVAGSTQVYNYNGESRTQDLALTRLLYRNAKRKTSFTLKGWHRTSKSFIDDAEITVQRRQVSGWQFNLDHREYIQSAVLDLSLGYKRGTGAFDALAAPEEAFNEGTSRMKVWLLDTNLSIPFHVAQQNLTYSSALRAQYNQTPLTAQDRMSIGGRYTVRGFDGNSTLMADRGFYWRNDLAWSYRPSHQIYLAVDGGHVGGQSAQHLVGRTLIGSALGLRGQFKLGGQFYYDLFAGTPIQKPTHFKTDKTTYGFSLNYSF